MQHNRALLSTGRDVCRVFPEMDAVVNFSWHGLPFKAAALELGGRRDDNDDSSL